MVRPSLLALALVACADDPVTGEGTALPDDPTDLELDLVAAPHTLALSSGEQLEVFAYDGTLPGPELHVDQGARLRVTLHNELPDGIETTIHWHGIEGTNAADGTGTTQDHVHPGESFTYDFVVPRPGIFWYHPHARGALTVQGGLYGALVVEDPDERRLRDLGVLPSREETLILSDVAVFFGMVEDPEAVDVLRQMNGTEGTHLLVDGQEQPTYEVPAGSGIRLRLINSSITRFYRLSLPGHTIFRVGGEGGLLDRVVVEGGTVTGEAYTEDGQALGPEEVDLGFAKGELVLSPGERADVVIVPSGGPGTEHVVRWEDYARGRHAMWMEGDEMVMEDAEDDGTRPGVDLFILRVGPSRGEAYTLAEGDPVLEAVGRQVEVLAAADLDWTGDEGTELYDWMEMGDDENGDHYMVNHFLIDGQAWAMESADGSHYGDVPYAPTARFAKLEDTIEWEVHNAAHMAHPFHLHGFSYQPVKYVKHVEDEATGEHHVVEWPAPYAEWEDTTLLPGETSVVFRVALRDVNGDGGAAGRWMKHCHILQHAEGGMMSELVVEP